MDLNDFVFIGKVTGAHGIRGAVKVYSEEASVALLQKGFTVLLVNDNGRAAHYTLQWVTPYKKGFRAAFKEIEDRNASEELVGAVVYADKVLLPALEQGTYYWSELIGLAVYDIKAGYLGKISSIMPTAGHDVYIVKDPEKGEAYEVLIPASVSVVTAVDLEQKMMQVNAPDGLIPDLSNLTG